MITAAPVHSAVSRRFLRRAAADPSVEVRLGYHGTQSCNFDPILRYGLSIPRKGGVEVANGSVHGVGIYTAAPGAAWLSKCFADSNSMLVCGILDKPDESTFRCPVMVARRTAKAQRPEANRNRQHRQARTQKLGMYTLRKETKDVRHVSDAQVVFNEECVVPLLKVDNVPPELYQPWENLGECKQSSSWFTAWRNGNPNSSPNSVSCTEVVHSQ